MTGKGCQGARPKKDVLAIERPLSVWWCVEKDEFGFKIFLKECPLTKRGILSVVSSICDPLGMAAPLIFPAKLLPQDLCRKGIEKVFRFCHFLYFSCRLLIASFCSLYPIVSFRIFYLEMNCVGCVLTTFPTTLNKSKL